MNFDRFAWAHLGWPAPARLVDTAELAKVAGYPSAKLEWLAENLLGEAKDMAGNAVTLALSKPEQYYGEALMARLELAKAAWREAHPRGSGAGRLPAAQLKSATVAELDRAGHYPASVPSDVVAQVARYCELDASLLARLLPGFLLPWLDSDLPGLEQADRALNDRGICFDRELAALLIDADAALGEAALAEAGVPRELVASPAQLRGALAVLGVEIDNAQADTLEAALKTAPEAAQRLIRARQATSSIASGKLRAGLARVSPDGRLRGNRNYYGAHTGRWAGKGMQLDNLSKGI